MSFLRIEKLGKIYPKSENLPPALDDINIEINNRGLVFIVGKSGSGKSTLLNLIGGLDAPTSGTIYIKDKAYSSFKEEDFDLLRRNEVGFIFQDFCLIDNLDVYENVKLALSIQNKIEDKDAILKAIEDVGLKGYEKHLGKELSAGQRQRVAIARAIVKSPEILLCDEPTGNLDFVTSHEVLQILQSLSKKSLVIIVSHNLEDAYVFADRIIELKQGCVIKDLSNNNSPSIVGQTAYISGIDFLSKEELEDVNSKISSGEIKQIKSRKELFANYKHEDQPYEEINYPQTRISVKKSFKLMNSLLKRQFLKIGLFSFISALIASMFSVSYMFVTAKEKTIYDQIAEQSKIISPIYRKTTDDIYHPSSIVTIYEKDLAKVRKSMPKEEFYPIVGITPFYSASSYFDTNNYPIYDATRSDYYDRLFDKNLYTKETNGVLITTEEYLKTLYNLETIEYLALADEIQPYGIYLSDFILDEYLDRNKSTNTYADYVGQLVSYENRVYSYTNRYINGVIKTDYKTKHASVFEQLNRLRTNNPGGLKEYQSSKEFRAYTRDVYEKYMYGYSFNPNFVKDISESGSRNCVRVPNAVMSIIYNEEESLIHDYRNGGFGNQGITSRFYHFDNYETPTSSNEVIIPFNVLNGIFQTTYTADEWNALLTSKKLTVKLYDSVTNKVVDTFTFDFVVGKNVGYMVSGEDVLKALNSYVIRYASILYGNQHNPKTVFSKMGLQKYMSLNIDGRYISHIIKGVRTYVDLFKILVSIAVVALLSILAFVSYNNIQRFTYEIGVIKSLGASNRDVRRIFSIQEIYLLVTSILMSIVGVIIAAFLANSVLAAAFNHNFSNMYTIFILQVDFSVILVVTGVIILTSIVAMIVPLIRMKKLKPINILKSRY